MRIAISIVVMIIMWAVARKKGFNPFLWVLGAGIPGLIVLINMPSASSQSISEAVRQRRRKVGDLVGLILTCVGIAAIYVIVLMLRSSSSVSPWDFIGIFHYAASLVMLIAVFQRHPETRSSWYTAFRWFYTAYFALGLVSELTAPSVSAILAVLFFAARLVMLIAVFQMYPETRSSWRTAFRWFYTAYVALGLVFLLMVQLGSMFLALELLSVLQILLWMGAAVSLLVLATLVSGRMDQKIGANQPSEGTR